MMKINVICVGNLKEGYLRDAAAEYAKRLSRFCKLEITEVKEDAIVCDGYTVALCVEGQMLSSEELAEKIDRLSLTTSKINFIIGGSDGLNEKIKKSADLQLSFSKMTFPHQLMRIFLLEQIYRSFTINNHITYHK